jgi:hypothetical protein
MRTAQHGNLFAKLNSRNLDGAGRGPDVQPHVARESYLVEQSGLPSKLSLMEHAAAAKLTSSLAAGSVN